MSRKPDLYDPSQYWSRLVDGEATLRSVAYPALAESFNMCLYSAMRTATISALRASGRKDLVGAGVLDIGSGTGVWTALWRELGARRVVGLDLSPAAVARLRELQPGVEFHQGDISEAAPDHDNSFDLVSAMSVLLHITDDSRFERAIANLAHLLSPRGAALIMDPVVMHEWWGPPFDETSNSKARKLDVWTEVLGRHGLEVTTVIPVTFLLANPVDTKHRTTFRVLSWYWTSLMLGVGRRERVGSFVGDALYWVDKLLLRVATGGPSTKMLVVRKIDKARNAVP